jgi:hypothetical protein
LRHWQNSTDSPAGLARNQSSFAADNSRGRTLIAKICFQRLSAAVVSGKFIAADSEV